MQKGHNIFNISLDLFSQNREYTGRFYADVRSGDDGCVNTLLPRASDDERLWAEKSAAVWSKEAKTIRHYVYSDRETETE